MGYSNAEGMAESVAGGLVSLDAAVSYHLTANHYPPLSPELVLPSILAIAAFNDGDFERDIALPDGMTYRDRDSAPAFALVEDFRLEPFLAVGLKNP